MSHWLTVILSVQLNRDTWGHEAVKDTVGTSFVFWQVCSIISLMIFLHRIVKYTILSWLFLQVYDDTEEGRKVCTYYKLLLMPSILVIDPLTGQKMRSWEGMISAERLLEVISFFFTPPWPALFWRYILDHEVEYSCKGVFLGMEMECSCTRLTC